MAPTLDAHVFERLVHTHHAAVFRSARRVLRSDAAAEDVTQEVFLRVLAGRLALAGDDEVVRRVLCWWSVHTALNERRATQRRRQREERHAMTRHEATGGDGVEDGRLWQLVDELPDDLRVPLVLRFGEELGFARIGELLGVAESTAHERVGRALGRLRAALASAGLVALAATLETRLAAGAPVAAPAGLAARLVGLGATRATASFGLVASLVFGVATLAGVAAWWSGSDVGGAPVERVESGASAVAAADVGDVARAVTASANGAAGAVDASTPPARRAAPSAAAAAADEEGDGDGDTPALDVLRGEALGRVLDASGAPVVGAAVTVHSLERAGKFAAYAASTTTDAAGGFRVPVAVADADGGLYAVQVTCQGYTITTSTPLRVRADAATDFGLVTASALSGEVLGEATLDLEVVDMFGVAVEHAVVELASVVELPVEPGTLWTEWTSRGDLLERIDGRAVCDARGAVHFTAASGGPKLVRVVPREPALAPTVLRFDLAVDEEARLFVALGPGRTITGLFETVDGPLADGAHTSIALHVRESISGEWLFGEVFADGRFEVRGLPPGTHRVEVAPNHAGAAIEPATDWSPTAFDVVIGLDELVADVHTVALKRRDDPRAVGSHLAELHGRAVRAEDGAPVPLDVWAIELEPAPDVDALAFVRDWLPNHLFSSPRQRMLAGPVPPTSDAFHEVGHAAGRYVLRCTTDGRAPLVHGPFELGEREVRAGLELVLTAPARVAGRVFDADGAPVDGAYVLVTGVGPLSDETVARGDAALRAADGRGWIDVNGSERRSVAGAFELPCLPAGIELRLVALHPDHAPVFGPSFTLEPAGALLDVELRFGP